MFSSGTPLCGSKNFCQFRCSQLDGFLFDDTLTQVQGWRWERVTCKSNRKRPILDSQLVCYNLGRNIFQILFLYLFISATFSPRARGKAAFAIAGPDVHQFPLYPGSRVWAIHVIVGNVGTGGIEEQLALIFNPTSEPIQKTEVPPCRLWATILGIKSPETDKN